MSHFVDTNQQRVCKKCGNRWQPTYQESPCQKCATERTLGGQILPQEQPKKEEKKTTTTFSSKKKEEKSTKKD